MFRCLPSSLHLLVVAILAASLIPPVVAAQPSWSYADLVQRLIDLEHPATLPAAGEKCAQWASWDRSSQYDAQTDKYVNWAANNDGPQFIREEGDQAVMAEMEGPGCIWRIWSARAEQGHVKIYLDGAPEPALDLPFVAYFRGDTAPFNYPQLSYDLATMGCRGQNLYFPIPYQRSCKIVAEKGWGRYYQFTYTTYPQGTQLPTFSSALAVQHATLPLILDGRFIAYRALMFLPFALFVAVAARWRPSLMPYLMAGHALIDFSTMMMVLQAAQGNL